MTIRTCRRRLAKPVDGDKVMHASVRIGDSVVLVSDGNTLGQPRFDGFSLSLTVADGGQLVMPPGKGFFSPAFGMLADRFGVHGMACVQA